MVCRSADRHTKHLDRQDTPLQLGLHELGRPAQSIRHFVPLCLERIVSSGRCQLPRPESICVTDPMSTRESSLDCTAAGRPSGFPSAPSAGIELPPVPVRSSCRLVRAEAVMFFFAATRARRYAWRTLLQSVWSIPTRIDAETHSASSLSSSSTCPITPERELGPATLSPSSLHV